MEPLPETPDFSRVNLEVLELPRIRAALKDAGLETTGTADEVARRLFDLTSAAPDAVACDCCMTFSDPDAYPDACPFCGSTDDEPAKTPEPAKKTAKKKATKKTTTKAAKEEKPTKPAAEPKRKKKTTTKKAPAKKTAAAAKPETKPTKTRTGGEIEREESAACEVLTVEQYEAEVQAVRDLLQANGRNNYEIAVRLAGMSKTKLYHMKRGDDGKPAYRTFADFCKAELRMTRQWVDKLIKAARTFSRDEWEEVGVWKLGMIVNVEDDETRKELYEVAKTSSQSELREELQNRQREPGFESDAPTRDRPTPSETPAPRVEPSEPLTTATVDQVVDIPLLTEAGEVANDFIDGLVGVETAANGVEIRYRLIIQDGRATLHVERKRR